MNFFKKLLNIAVPSIEEVPVPVKDPLSLDDSFVHQFIEKGGKFLYCSTKEEVLENLQHIVSENNWSELVCTDKKLLEKFKKSEVSLVENTKHSAPFLTSCEHLISDNGQILFSSNQLKSQKLPEFHDHFIVYAKTSQLVNNVGQGLTGIKTNFKGNIPTNISAVKNYVLTKDDDNFMNYGSSNSKNLYLLLFEDL